MKKLAFLLVALVLAVVMILTACGPKAPETVTWAVSGVDPATSAQVGVVMEMADAITERSGGRLQFEYHQWAELGYKGPELLKLYESGTATFGEMGGSYVIGEEPMVAITMLPFMATRDTLKPMLDAVRPYVVETLAKRNVKPLIFSVYPNVLWNKFPINSKDDFKKLKVRCHQPVIVALENLGSGTGITMPFADIYQALATDILTGTPMGLDSATSVGFQEQCKYLYKSPIWNTAPTYWVVNMDAFNALPKDVQEIVDNAAVEFEPKLQKVVWDGTPEIHAMIEEAKVNVIDSMDPALIEWVQNEGGKPTWQQWSIDHPETKEALDALLAAVGMSL